MATAVYGSYDCPEVWVLRRFRDNILAHAMIGRLLIRLYYAISPTIVKIFGKTKPFQLFWRKVLDRFVLYLMTKGIADTVYYD